MTTNATSTAAPVRYTFMPILTLTPREDGRYDADIDWGDAYHDEGVYPRLDVEAEGPSRACEAVDAWVKKFPKRFVIDTPPTQG